jgi:ABC-type nitrate/sulfonate/bicarbonate transport system ATPase subunit
VSARLVLDGVRVDRGGDPVLHDVDLEVGAGEVLAVLGPNGAGKSTLLAAVGGMLPVAAGEVRTEGRVATVLQEAGMARRTARANVELALAWWGVPRPERPARARAALDTVGAAALADRPARRLSGGERRRVHLARALAVGPDVLLLDEPFAGLDATTHAALLEDTAPALRRADTAVVLVVHELADAWALADRIAVLIDGRIAGTGSPAGLLAAPPTPAVARLLGYDGMLERAGGTLMTRPTQVRIGMGEWAGVVTASLAEVDGFRITVRTDAGTVRARSTTPHRIGEEVRFTVVGGVDFARGRS